MKGRAATNQRRDKDAFNQSHVVANWLSARQLETSMAFRPLTTAARKTLRIGLIPADGIGREVIPVSTIVKMCVFNRKWLYCRRPHAEHWKLWDLTFPSLSFMICLLGSICSRGRELPYPGRLWSKCDPDVTLFHQLMNGSYLQSIKEWMRRSFVWSRQVSTNGLT